MRGRSRSGPSAIFDPPRKHLDSCNFRADSDPRRSGVQALMSTCKDSAYGSFHNGSHGVEAACAFSPPGWSRSFLARCPLSYLECAADRRQWPATRQAVPTSGEAARNRSKAP